MADWMIKRRLARNSSQLTQLRGELRELDEQLEHLRDDADDSAVRALVSDHPGASVEASDARKHADALARHRRHVADRIGELERRQDELLDRLTS